MTSGYIWWWKWIAPADVFQKESERCGIYWNFMVFLCSIYSDLFRFYQSFIWFQLVSIDFIWLHLTTVEFRLATSGNYWGGWLDILLRDAETFLSGRKNGKNRKKSKKSKKMNWKNRRNRFFRSCCCGRNWVTFETQCPLGNLGSSLGSGFLCPQFPQLGSYLRCPSMIF